MSGGWWKHSQVLVFLKLDNCIFHRKAVRGIHLQVLKTHKDAPSPMPLTSFSHFSARNQLSVMAVIILSRFCRFSRDGAMCRRVWIYSSLFNQDPVGEHLGCFQFFSFIKNIQLALGNFLLKKILPCFIYLLFAHIYLFGCVGSSRASHKLW